MTKVNHEKKSKNNAWAFFSVGLFFFFRIVFDVLFITYKLITMLWTYYYNTVLRTFSLDYLCFEPRNGIIPHTFNNWLAMSNIYTYYWNLITTSSSHFSSLSSHIFVVVLLLKNTFYSTILFGNVWLKSTFWSRHRS